MSATMININKSLNIINNNKMIGTIKLPKNLSAIGSQLPKANYNPPVYKKNGSSQNVNQSLDLKRNEYK